MKKQLVDIDSLFRAASKLDKEHLYFLQDLLEEGNITVYPVDELTCEVLVDDFMLREMNESGRNDEAENYLEHMMNSRMFEEFVKYVPKAKADFGMYSQLEFAVGQRIPYRKNFLMIDNNKIWKYGEGQWICSKGNTP